MTTEQCETTVSTAHEILTMILRIVSRKPIESLWVEVDSVKGISFNTTDERREGRCESIKINPQRMAKFVDMVKELEYMDPRMVKFTIHHDIVTVEHYTMDLATGIIEMLRSYPYSETLAQIGSVNMKHSADWEWQSAKVVFRLPTV